jgi:L-ascorbate metabolism protein UlaG (beta-lactamase superfamily)
MIDSQVSLDDGARIHVLYEDNTRFGSAISGLAEATLRVRCASVAEARKRDGLAAVVARSRALCDSLMLPGALGDYFEAPGKLRAECAYPDPAAVRPAALLVERAERGTASTVALEAGVAPDLARWIGDLQRGAARPARGPAGRLFDALDAAGALRPAAPAPVPVAGDVTFAGHATLCFSAGASRLLVDPFVLPGSPRYPAGYQPLTFGELAPTAVLLTHAHPDHFDLGSLLRLGADTPIIVPQVERESLLGVDMAARLRELGFARVAALRWHEAAQIGDFTVRALPFYGEQPTTGEVLSPDVRNLGNTYLIEGGGKRYAVVADAGCDHLGSSRAVAAAARLRFGPVDALFGGYRSFAVYPIQYLFSSVSRYLLFVPEHLQCVRQQIMNGPDELLDMAETWGAGRVVPYADGGAPWYWERGLGPRLDQPASPYPHVDAPPECVADAAARRASSPEGFIRSPARVELLRPGQSRCFGGDDRARVSGSRWPYAASGGAAPGLPGDQPAEETAAALRKRGLLDVLSRLEAERSSLVPGPDDVQRRARRFRERFGLLGADTMMRWLEFAGMTVASFSDFIFSTTLIERIEASWSRAIAGGLVDHRRLQTVHAFARRRAASDSTGARSAPDATGAPAPRARVTADDLAGFVREGESEAVSRKKVLLRLLADRELEAGGVALHPGEVDAATAGFRRLFGLDAEDDFTAWLASAGLRREEVEAAMSSFAAALRLEEAHAQEVAACARRIVAARSVYRWEEAP